MEYALRISDTGQLQFMESVKDWVLQSDFITSAAGCIERPVRGRLHWQLAIRVGLSGQVLRKRLLAAFPGLKGDTESRSKNYSIGTCRKDWETNICYCLKDMEIPILSDFEHMVVMKGVTVDDLLAARTRYVTASNKPTSKPRTYLENLVQFVKEDGSQSDEGILAAMVEYHHVKGQPQPDIRFGYPRLLETVKLEMVCPENYEDSKYNLVNKILRSL